MPTPASPEPTHCPLCGQANLCAMEAERLTGVKQAPCWCTQVDFSRAALHRIPDAARGKACICQACATQAGTGPAAA